MITMAYLLRTLLGLGSFGSLGSLGVFGLTSFLGLGSFLGFGSLGGLGALGVFGLGGALFLFFLGVVAPPSGVPGADTSRPGAAPGGCTHKITPVSYKGTMELIYMINTETSTEMSIAYK